MTAKDIQYYLEHNYFKTGCKFVIPNIYFFGSGHESDLLVVKQNDFSYEVEIKISKADYLNDFKKPDRHQVIETGTFYRDYKTCLRNKEGALTWYEPGDPIYCSRANRFYFACPENLIKIEDIPYYTGLFYILPDGSVQKVKEAKLLHKEKLTDFERLASKCYWMWKTQKQVLKNPKES